MTVSCNKDEGSVEGLSFRTIDGKIYRWDRDLKGKILIVDFWATWCQPCRKSMPDLEEIYNKYKGDVLVIGFSKDDNPKVVEDFIRNEIKVSYPIGMSNRKIEDRFGGILGLPTAFLIDRNGKIIRRFIGYVPIDVWESNIKKLL